MNANEGVTNGVFRQLWRPPSRSANWRIVTSTSGEISGRRRRPYLPGSNLLALPAPRAPIDAHAAASRFHFVNGTKLRALRVSGRARLASTYQSENKRNSLIKPKSCVIVLLLAGSKQSGAGGEDRAWRANGALETFCTQPETRVDFSYFFARNPLKSPDSDE